LFINFYIFNLVQTDGKKKRSAKDEIIISSDEEEMSAMSEEEEEEATHQKRSKKGSDRDYEPNETSDDGTDSSEGWSEEEDESPTNAEGASALLDVIEKEKKKPAQKNAGQKRKVPPIKISDLAVKKQKTENVRSRKAPKRSTGKPPQVKQSSATSNPDSTPAVVDQDQGEKGFDPTTITVVEKKKKESPVFNDKNLDYNLFSDDPDNVVSKKIKIAKNVILQCSMIDGNEKGKNAAFQDYAALSFLRKTKDEKAFEFNLPLGLAPNIIEALKLIINDNPKFFHKYKA